MHSYSNFDLSQLPSSFKKFLDDNSIDPAIYTVVDLPRYFRINTGLPKEKRPTLEGLREQFKTDQVQEIKGIKGFFSVKLDNVRLSDTQAYRFFYKCNIQYKKLTITLGIKNLQYLA